MTRKGNRIVAGHFRENGHRYVVYLDYREEPAQAEHGQTIDHRPIPPEAVTVAISGETWRATTHGARDRRYGDCVSAGQNVDDLRRIGTPRALRIAALWDRWHLNGMRPNCAHMPDQRYDPALTCAYGYKSGTAWLFEEVPSDVLAELRQLFGIARLEAERARQEADE